MEYPFRDWCTTVNVLGFSCALSICDWPSSSIGMNSHMEIHDDWWGFFPQTLPTDPVLTI